MLKVTHRVRYCQVVSMCGWVPGAAPGPMVIFLPKKAPLQALTPAKVSLSSPHLSTMDANFSSDHVFTPGTPVNPGTSHCLIRIKFSPLQRSERCSQLLSPWLPTGDQLLIPSLSVGDLIPLPSGDLPGSGLAISCLVITTFYSVSPPWEGSPPLQSLLLTIARKIHVGHSHA